MSNEAFESNACKIRIEFKTQHTKQKNRKRKNPPKMFSRIEIHERKSKNCKSKSYFVKGLQNMD